MRPEVRVGTCGFRSNKLEYSKALNTVEVQHTFYQPPMVKTLERWRAELPPNFEFTLKAWQLITHESASPTYKRLRAKFSNEDLMEAGSFRSTQIVNEAWETTLACARALKARTVLFQCPASFTPTSKNIKNLERFFSSVERNGLNFAWEPRGLWTDKVIKKICGSHDLWHVVDPFTRSTVTPERCYFRLHGRVRWRYQYEDSELEELASMMPTTLSYVFFNNITMVEDAQRFQAILSSAGGRSSE